MSHFSGHVRPQVAGKPPSSRVAIMGASLFAVGFLGFYSYLNRRHERKIVADPHDHKVSAWESRLLQRSTPASDSANPTTLRASRVQLRATPMNPPVTEHNAQHRSIATDRSNGLARDHPNVYQQPTAQRDGGNGYVYTKRINGNGEGVGERKKPGIKPEVTATVEEVKENVTDAAKGVKERIADMLGGKKN